MWQRTGLKALLARGGSRRPASGATLLTYHRVGGGSSDELDMPAGMFVAQLDQLVGGGHEVVALDVALDRLAAGDRAPSVVLTFDDGFADVHHHAWPRLAERQLPFTLYLAAGLVGAAMAWEGSSARSQGAPALTWDQVGEMVGSGLCTVGNHTYTHAGPDAVDVGELDRCSDAIDHHLGVTPKHFAWTWGVPVPALMPAVRERFRSAATGQIGRNLPSDDSHGLKRVPVRASDPMSFFRAKLSGELWPERTYDHLVRGAKRARQLVSRG